MCMADLQQSDVFKRLQACSFYCTTLHWTPMTWYRRYSLGNPLLKLQVDLFWKNKGLFPQLQQPFALRNGQSKSMRQFLFCPNPPNPHPPFFVGFGFFFFKQQVWFISTPKHIKHNLIYKGWAKCIQGIILLNVTLGVNLTHNFPAW